MVACVLHVPENGRCDYNADYVMRLRNMVARHLKANHEFVCLSNVDVPVKRIPLKHGWRGWWSKLELFRPDIKADRILYIDLDTVITGNLSEIADINEFTMIEGFRNNADKRRRGSGLMMLTDRRPVWDAWAKSPEAHVEKIGNKGDQHFIGPFSKGCWQHALPGQVVSYKHDVRDRDELPNDARVVCFHGKPRPHQLPDDHWMRNYWN